jgi:hypothetical protein
MKAEIKLNGLLIIQAESELEAYALSTWVEENNADKAFNPEKIQFRWDIDKIKFYYTKEPSKYDL